MCNITMHFNTRTCQPILQAHKGELYSPYICSSSCVISERWGDVQFDIHISEDEQPK